MDKNNTIKAVGESEKVISEYNGQSIRKMADAWRAKSNGKFPVVYTFCSSLPIRTKDGKKVIVEGRHELGCIWNGKKERLAYVFALLGFKLPCGGTLEKCESLKNDYRDAIAGIGKYASKAPKAEGKKGGKKTNK